MANEFALKVLLESLEYDREYPLDARVTETEEFTTYRREKIDFHGGRDERVPGYLYIPLTGESPHPCVLLFHGGGAGKQEELWPDHEALIDGGLAILSLDAKYHGERLVEGLNPKMRLLFERGWVYLTRDMLIESVVNHRRGIDYLETRPEIDAGRIGARGASMGSHIAFLLIAADSRVKAASLATGPLGRVGVFEPSPEQMVAINYAPAVTDVQILFLMGRQDPFNSVNSVEDLIAAIPSPHKKVIWYESGHGLPWKEAIPKMNAWLLDHLP